MIHSAETTPAKTIKLGCIKMKDSYRAKPTRGGAEQRTRAQVCGDSAGACNLPL